MGKICERIIVNRVINCDKQKGLENRNQFGFKPKMATEDACLQFKESLIMDRKYVIALFVNIERAFDNLWWSTI